MGQHHDLDAGGLDVAAVADQRLGDPVIQAQALAVQVVAGRRRWNLNSGNDAADPSFSSTGKDDQISFVFVHSGSKNDKAPEDHSEA